MSSPHPTKAPRGLLILNLLVTTAALVVGVVILRRLPPPGASAPIEERADELMEGRRFAGAALAYDRAASLASGGEAMRLAEVARRARALSWVARATPPGESEWPTVEALAASLEASTEVPDQRIATLLRVVLLRARARITGALELAREARADGDESVWLSWQLGSIFLLRSQGADAAAELERVAHDAPEFAPALHLLGLAYVTEKRKEGAIGALQRALEKGAGDGAQLDLARVFLNSGMWAEAQPHLEAVLSARPNHMEALRLLAASHFQLKRYALAAQTYQKAYALSPQPRTLLSAAIALHTGGDHAGALRLLDQLRPQEESLPEILFERANVLLEMSRTEDGDAALRRYLTLAGDRPGEAERVKAVKARLASE